MSKYNKYARELNQVFKETADQYNSAYNKWQEAERKNKAGVGEEREIFPGYLDAKKKQLEIDCINAKAEFEDVQRNGWRKFINKRDQLKRQLEKEVKQDSLANPDDLDNDTITILNSGIVKGDDLESLAERFSGNCTMSRLIAEKAGELAEKEKDPAERTRLNALEHKCKNAKPKVLEDWDSLSSVADHYSGNSSRNREPGYIMKISDHWNDSNVQEAIENF